MFKVNDEDTRVTSMGQVIKAYLKAIQALFLQRTNVAVNPSQAPNANKSNFFA